MAQRKVILHYHLFKNAGTSIDQILKKSLGDFWRSYDMSDGSAVITSATFTALIENLPQIVAWSSHQVVPPIPQIKDVKIFPIVFIRHPLDRARSAYLFEWQKQQTKAKPIGSFAAYIKQKFASPRRNAIEDFQTIRLSNPYSNSFRNPKQVSDSELLEQAKNFLQSLLFLGIVDEFEASIAKLKDYLAQDFPQLHIEPYKANVLQDISLSMEEKLMSIKEELGEDIFNLLAERNQLDLALYNYAKQLFVKSYP
ncbi:MAG: sulfotransferase family 2 domain-containing protein [Deinococcales bacterium]